MDPNALNEDIRLAIQAQQERSNLLIAEMLLHNDLRVAERVKQDDLRFDNYFFNLIRDRRPVYPGNRKLILYINMHGGIINTPLITHTHCPPDYYNNRVKYASKSSPGTIAWTKDDSEQFEYNTIRRLYSSTNNDVFDMVRKELRRLYNTKMDEIKLEHSQYTGNDNRLKSFTKAIRENIDDESYTAQRGISTERNYWASFEPKVTNSYFSTNTNNKLYVKYGEKLENGEYPENDERHNIYIADAFGIPELQLLDNGNNTLIAAMQQIFTNINDDVTPLQKQFKLVKQKLEKAEPDIYLSDILNLMCVADIDVEIFDASCSRYKFSGFFTAPRMKRIISKGELKYGSDEFLLTPNVDEEYSMPQPRVVMPPGRGGKSKKRKKIKYKNIKSKKRSNITRKLKYYLYM